MIRTIARRTGALAGALGFATASLFGPLFAPLPARAETRAWVGGTSSWDVANNWMLPGVPGQGDGVVIGQANANVSYVNSDNNKTVFANVDVGNSGSATATLLQSQSQLLTNRLYVGITGKGAVNLSGGSLTVSGLEGMSLGQGLGSAGSFTLGGWGTLTVAGQALIGDSGTGTFNQTAGNFVVNAFGSLPGQILIAAIPAASGTHTISGGTVVADSIQLAPSGGNAMVAQSGGSVGIRTGTILSDLSVGDLSVIPKPGVAVYQHTGGSLTTPQLNIGELGTFRQAGGTLRTGALTINTGGGRLDVAQNLVVDYDPADGSPAATIRSYLRGGFNGGTWDGSGIMSSIAGSVGAVGYADAGALLNLAGTQTATWNGQTVDASTILLRYTLAGDANLDGRVDFGDLVKLAQNYNAASAQTWMTGDFTYDDKVDFLDLVKLAQNYNGSIPGGAAPVPGATADFDADVAAAFASVPEPTAAVTLLTLGAVGLIARPRKARARGKFSL